MAPARHIEQCCPSPSLVYSGLVACSMRATVVGHFLSFPYVAVEEDSSFSERTHPAVAGEFQHGELLSHRLLCSKCFLPVFVCMWVGIPQFCVSCASSMVLSVRTRAVSCGARQSDRQLVRPRELAFRRKAARRDPDLSWISLVINKNMHDGSWICSVLWACETQVYKMLVQLRECTEPYCAELPPTTVAHPQLVAYRASRPEAAFPLQGRVPRKKDEVATDWTLVEEWRPTSMNAQKSAGLPQHSRIRSPRLRLATLSISNMCFPMLDASLWFRLAHCFFAHHNCQALCHRFQKLFHDTHGTSACKVFDRVCCLRVLARQWISVGCFSLPCMVVSFYFAICSRRGSEQGIRPLTGAPSAQSLAVLHATAWSPSIGPPGRVSKTFMRPAPQASLDGMTSPDALARGPFLPHLPCLLLSDLHQNQTLLPHVPSNFDNLVNEEKEPPSPSASSSLLPPLQKSMPTLTRARDLFFR